MTSSDGAFKGAHKNISFEEFKLNQMYSITISPCDDYQYWNDEDRLDKARDYFSKNILSKLPFCFYEIYLEVSPLGRIHYHGFFKIDNLKMLKRFYLMTIRYLQLRSTFEIDTIKDQEIWHTYCSKQYNSWGIVFRSDNKLSKINKGIYKKLLLEEVEKVDIN